MEIKQITDGVLKEVSAVVSEIDAGQASAFIDEVVAAKRVFVFGEGRSGLVARAFAMRVMQLGLEAHVVGETTTPAIHPGDLFVAVSGSGLTASTVLFAENAKGAGGTVAAVVSSAQTKLGSIADVVLVIPGKAKTGVGMDSSQMPGSLFEQATFMFFDAAVVMLVQKRGESYQGMANRHTNLQ